MTVQTVQHDSIARLTRWRRTSALRDLCRQTRLAPADFVEPVFVVDDPAKAGPIASLPGVVRSSLQHLPRRIDALQSAGVRGALLFGVPASKDDSGSAAHDPAGIVPRAIAAFKKYNPDVAVIADVCLCQYTSHGLCSVTVDGRMDLEASLNAIARTAETYAEAGADVVAPSSMHDGAVAAIRARLDDTGHEHVAILSYAAKFASSLYGPFREAAGSSQHSGANPKDRRMLQIDCGNAHEAIREAEQDVREGADAIMVKPAGTSLDVISHLHGQLRGVPVAAYQVSGEYAAIMAAAERGWLDERDALMETLTAIKRAGATMIVTYAATRAARWALEDSAGHARSERGT